MTDTRPDWKALTRDEKLAAIRPMIAETMTSSQIAARFIGASRGSILGACFRAGLKMEANPGARMAPKPRNKGRGQPKAAAITHRLIADRRKPPTPPAIEPFDMEDGEGVDVSHLLGLMDLERNSCRWPVTGTGSATLFCGTHATHGPYCADHAARAGLGYGRGPRP